MSDPHKGGDGPWRAWALGLTVFSTVFFAVLGFLVLPVVQGRAIELDAWAAICRAVGIAPGTPAMRQPQSAAVAQPVSKVAWDAAVLKSLSRGDVLRGQQLAIDVCSACHGEQGVSPSSDFPHLSGQSATAIYKQLHDYQTGARSHRDMTPVAVKLTLEQLADVAAFYGRGGDNLSLGKRSLVAEPQIARIVAVGAPDRGIPSCNSCHGAGVGGPIETPTLVGQHRQYIERQLELYATRGRTNDVYARMRSIAARLTPAERQELARYYEGTS